MPATPVAQDFGSLLKFLRKRAHLTQRDLAQVAGYSEAQICRLEKNERLPDLTTLAALIIPALDLNHDPANMERLLQLAAQARAEQGPASIKINQLTIQQQTVQELGALEDIPAAPPNHIARPALLKRLTAILTAERCVALCGLAGVGKTVLAAELARAHQTGPVFWLTLTAGVTANAEVVTRQLALFFFSLGHMVVQPMLEARTPLPLDQQLTLLRAALAKQPAWLCFDDAHLLLGDEAGKALLHTLATATSASLLLTSREAVLPPFTQIRIDGLERDEALALAERLGLNPNLPLTERLVTKTQGNPMLLRLVAGQWFDGEGGAEAFVERLESQPQVSAYLLNALSQALSPDAQWLSMLLAVFRHPLNLHDEVLADLCEAAGHPLRAELGVELQRHYLITDTSRASLAPLVRDHLYAGLTTRPKRKRDLHRLAAQWAERTGADSLEAAFHFNCAGQVKRAVDMLTGQEELFFQRGQALQAADILAEAIRGVHHQRPNAGQSNLLRRIHQARGNLLLYSTRNAEAETNYRAALALSNSPQARADIVYCLTITLVVRGEFAEALTLAQSARAPLTPADTLLRAHLEVSLAMAHYNLGQYPEARQAAEEALKLTEQFRRVSWQKLEEIRAQAHYWIANAARIQREGDVALSHTRQALAAAQMGGLLRLENTLLRFLGGLLYDRGEVEESFQFRSQSASKALALGNSHGAAYSLIHLSSNHLLRCEAEAALGKLNQARELLEQVGDAHGLADQANIRASCLLALGQLNEALAVLEPLWQNGATTPRTRMAGYYLNKLALIQLISEPTNHPAAHEILLRALTIPAVVNDAMLVVELNSTLALVKLAGGEFETAKQILDDSPMPAGISLWAKLNRSLVFGFVALSFGQLEKVPHIAESVIAQSSQATLYQLRAKRLATAIQNPEPNSFARLMWVTG